MNKLPCNVIQDLLPLYADDVVSPESRDLVETHIETCTACGELLREIRAGIPAPYRTDDQVLRKLRIRQFWRGLVGFLFAGLVLGHVFALIYVNFLAEQTTNYGAENFSVFVTQEGQPRLVLDEEARGAHVYYLYDTDADGTTALYLYIYDRDNMPEWLHQLLRLRSPKEPFFMEYNIGPLSNAAGDQWSNYLGVGSFLLDSSISRVYYQQITREEQQDFYHNYLLPDRLEEYDVSEKIDRTVIWERGE